MLVLILLEIKIFFSCLCTSYGDFLIRLSLLVQREGKALPEASLPFHRAAPSMTHMALVELEKAGILKFVISQVELLRFCSMYILIFFGYVNILAF